jgi:hypothetical protein
MGCRDYIALTGLPDPLQGNNIGYVPRPETQALARHVGSVHAGVHVVVAKDELFSDLESAFAKANKTSMLLLGSCCIHMLILGLL